MISECGSVVKYTQLVESKLEDKLLSAVSQHMNVHTL